MQGASSSSFSPYTNTLIYSHTNPVTALTYLGDDKVASGSLDNMVKIWDSRTGHDLQTFSCGHHVYALTPLGADKLASGLGDNSVKIWDLKNPKEYKSLEGHMNKVYALAHLGSDTLASGSADNKVKIWNLETGQIIKILGEKKGGRKGQRSNGHTNCVYALTPLGPRQLASGSKDTAIKIWDFHTGKELKTLAGHSRSVRALTHLGAGQLASGSNDTTVKIWDRRTGKATQTLTGHRSGVLALTHLGADQLASGSSDKTVKIWDRRTGKAIQDLTDHANCVRALTYLGRGQLASGSTDKTVKIWYSKTEAVAKKLKDKRSGSSPKSGSGFVQGSQQISNNPLGKRNNEGELIGLTKKDEKKRNSKQDKSKGSGSSPKSPPGSGTQNQKSVLGKRKNENSIKKPILNLPANPSLKSDQRKVKKQRCSKESLYLRLIRHKDEIKCHVAVVGQWSLPESLKNDFNNESEAFKEHLFGEDVKHDMGVDLFKLSPLLLDEFCRLKIQELHYLRDTTPITPTSDIQLAFLEAHKDGVDVLVVKLVFHNALVTTVETVHESKRYNNVLDALRLSPWMQDPLGINCLRFADVVIQDMMDVREFCKSIKYFHESDFLQTKTDLSQLNFWESLIKTASSKIPVAESVAAIESINRDFLGSVEETSIDIARPIVDMASRMSEQNQLERIKKIIKNQLNGMGSLLYLPTGSGKTYIMLGAIAHHYRQMDTKKSYLVVVPQNNVQGAWKENLDTELRDYEKDDSQLFGEDKISYVLVKSQPVLTQLIQECQTRDVPKYQLIIVTITTLTSYLKSCISGEEMNKSFSSFIPFLKECGIVMGDSVDKPLIYGEESFWINKIQEGLRGSLVLDEIWAELEIFLGKHDVESDVDTDDSQSVEDLLLKPTIKQAFYKMTSEQVTAFATNCGVALTGTLQEQQESLYLFFRKAIGFKTFRNDFKLTEGEPKDLDKIFKKFSSNQLWARRVRDSCNFHLISELNTLKFSQIRGQKKYRNFCNLFNGIICDEIDHILSVTATQTLSGREFVLDVSRTMLMQPASSGQCKLVIGASATPWPNDLKQLRYILQFIANPVLRKYAQLNDELFKLFTTFENLIRSGSPKMQEISNCYEDIARFLHPWIKLFFSPLVVYDSSKGESNKIDDHLLYLKAQDQDYIEIGEKSADVLGSINKYYANLLSDYSNKSLLKNDISSWVQSIWEESKWAQPERKDAQHFSEIVTELFKKLKSAGHHESLAIFVHEHRQALIIEQIVRKMLADVGRFHDEVVFYFAEEFVKKQGQKGPKADHYDFHMVFNGDRNVNKRDFNGEFTRDGFKVFLRERFDQTYLDKAHTTFYDNVIFFMDLVDYFYFQGPLPEVPNQWVDKNLGRLISDFLEGASLDETHFFPIIQRDDYGQQINTDLNNLFLFLKKIVEFEKRSMSTIVEFATNPIFVDLHEFLPDPDLLPGAIKEDHNRVSSLTQDCDKDFFKFVDALLFNLNRNERVEYFDSVTNHKNFMLSTKVTLMAYLYKVSRTNVMIFGSAGTSGMRLDAHHMLMLSGAWTEGTLAQLRGRGGRRKGACEPRECKLYAPLSDSSFEYFILKYFTIKALYDEFITSETPLSKTDLAGKLFLAYRLYEFYQVKSNFLTVKFLEKVKVIGAETYVKMPAFQKAMEICPDDIATLHSDFCSRLAKTAGRHSESPFPQLNDLSGLPPVSSPSVLKGKWPLQFQRALKLFWEEKCKECSKKGQVSASGEGTASEVVQLFESEFVTIQLQRCWTVDGSKDIEQSACSDPDLPIKSGEQHDIIDMEMVIPLSLSADESYSQFLETGSLIIKSDVIMESYRKKLVCSVNQGIRTTYKVTDSTIHLIGDPPPYFYFNVTMLADFRESVSNIQFEDIQLLGQDYVLFGYTAGGQSHGQSHFVCYKSSPSGYYECDDLQPFVVHHQEKSLSPILPKNVEVVKFVRKDYLESELKIVPKQFKNEDSLCYLHSAFQLIDNQHFRNLVVKYCDQLVDPDRVIRLPRPDITFDETAKITDSDLAAMDAFVDSKKKLYILIVPTRGESPDIDPAIFCQKLQDVADKRSIQFLMILGLNQSTQGDLSRVKQAIASVSGKRSDHLFVKLSPFLWNTDHKEDGRFPPIGQMRNACLTQAGTVYRHLKSKYDDHQNVSLLSMDADTILTEATLQYFEQESTKYPDDCVIVSGGFTIPDHDQLGLLRLGLALGKDNLSKHSELARAAELSMNINAGLQQNVLGVQTHFGYPPEPTIFMNGHLVHHLLDEPTCFHKNTSSEYEAIFGWWRYEGRRVFNHVFNHYHAHRIGPSTAIKDRPLLCNFERFALKGDPIDYPFSGTLSSDSMLAILRHYSTQPISSMKSRTMGSNIAYVLGARSAFVRKAISLFSTKNALLYLGLGPQRSKLFFQFVRAYFNDKSDIDMNISSLKISVGDLKTFVGKVFEPVLITPYSQTYSQHTFIGPLCLWGELFSDKVQSLVGTCYEGESAIKMLCPDDYPAKSSAADEADDEVSLETPAEDLSETDLMDEEDAPSEEESTMGSYLNNFMSFFGVRGFGQMDGFDDEFNRIKLHFNWLKLSWYRHLDAWVAASVETAEQSYVCPTELSELGKLDKRHSDVFQFILKKDDVPPSVRCNVFHFTHDDYASKWNVYQRWPICVNKKFQTDIQAFVAGGCK
ncbi:hypothetical protein DID76_03365 [Candidatus Marinamargulisbacteria bacterium SCGC AG-414-C22]|nr:hypothetical protein DID76_03365 [Candidatus Marinamargulisbacteria bacterium SCGC AG-414-C22]